MNERSWERFGAASGLLSAILLAAGVLVVPPMRGLSVTPMTINTYFADNATRVSVSALLVTLAAVVFLWFVGHLRHVLQRAEGGAEAFSPIVFAAGVTLAAVAILAMVPAGALAFLARSPEGMMMGAGAVSSALYGTHLLSGAATEFLIALFAGTAGIAMVRRELAGPWLGWLGLPVALIGLVAGISTYLTTAVPTFTVVMGYLTFATFILWVGTASIVMLYRPEVERTPTARTVFAH
jgi:hypothetical protein